MRLGKLETNVGNLYHRIDALDDALAHYDRAARYFEGRASASDRARVAYNRANILTSLGRVEEAERLYLWAREQLDRAGHTILRAQVSYGVACLRFLAGDYASAMTELEEVRPKLRSGGARSLLALADLDLSEVLLAIRLHAEALELARSAARWFRSRKMPVELAKSLLVAGIAATHLGRHRSASRDLSAAERLFRAQRHRPGAAAVRLARARLLLSRARPGEAAPLALRAEREFRTSRFATRALAAGATATEALAAAGDRSRAKRWAEKLLARRRHPGDGPSRISLLRALGGLEADCGRKQLALSYYEAALKEWERTVSTMHVDEWRLCYGSKEPALLDELLALALSSKKPPSTERLWEWIARARSVGSSSVPRIDGPRAAEIRSQIGKLRAELEACYASLLRTRNDTRHPSAVSASEALERRTLRLERRLRRLAGSDRRRKRSTGVRTGPHPPSVGEIDLVYFTAGGRLGAWVRGAEGARIHADLGPVAEVDRFVRLFHYQLETLAADFSALRRHRRTLERRAADHLDAIADRILRPVLAREQVVRRLRISPSGPLFRLPFAALPWQGDRLGAKVEIVVEATPGSVRHGSRRRFGACVLGYATDEPNRIETEASWVASALSGDRSPVELHIGSTASRSALVRCAPNVAVLHVAGHALYRPEHPEFSSLRLADGWINVADLSALPLDGAVVVLSACETGPRGVAGTDEMLGLARGLLHAGAATVLASLWRIDDRATAVWMNELYDLWRRTGRLGGALQALHGSSAMRSRSLREWAPFVLLGDGDARWPGDLRSNETAA